MDHLSVNADQAYNISRAVGNDAQEHFAAKFRTIERAYQVLNGAEAHTDRVIG